MKAEILRKWKVTFSPFSAFAWGCSRIQGGLCLTHRHRSEHFVYSDNQSLSTGSTGIPTGISEHGLSLTQGVQCSSPNVPTPNFQATVTYATRIFTMSAFEHVQKASALDCSVFCKWQKNMIQQSHSMEKGMVNLEKHIEIYKLRQACPIPWNIQEIIFRGVITSFVPSTSSAVVDHYHMKDAFLIRKNVCIDSSKSRIL